MQEFELSALSPGWSVFLDKPYVLASVVVHALQAISVIWGVDWRKRYTPDVCKSLNIQICIDVLCEQEMTWNRLLVAVITVCSGRADTYHICYFSFPHSLFYPYYVYFFSVIHTNCMNLFSCPIPKHRFPFPKSTLAHTLVHWFFIHSFTYSLVHMHMYSLTLTH